ncbi:MAG: MCE family protein [Candidatus Eremiobacteraeota bacterium]|nr:MCE family protein [Candidatus Eremiobacteraeota bacterium]MBV8497638.1 MCE family protein [Candidatus Eremiobacteraeota bacterium]
MTRQAQVGAFAIVALLLLFGIFYVITDFGTRHTGYRVGIHFQSAAGVTPGALVYFSGVNIGSVDSIELLPDNTVDVILAINRDIDIPAESRFLISAPLTGSPSVVIVPPRQKPPIALLPRQVLPIAQQPHGTNTATIADVLQQGQSEIKRFDRVMALLEARTPRLLDTLQATLNNANDLTASTKADMQRLTGQFLVASANVVQLSATLNSAAATDSQKVGVLLDRFNSTAVALDRSMGSLQSLATDPRLKANILATTQHIAETTATIAAMTKDLRSVTGDPQTQAQIRNTIANLDAVMQKANSLLAELGGTSNVYGVDQGATPAPSGSAAPGSSPPPGGTGISPAARANLHAKLANLAHDLVAIQVRLSGLSPQHNPGLNPVLTSSQGPLGDINLVVLPHAHTNLMVGANAIGNNTTWNAVLQQQSGNFRYGAGVLYSQIGVLGQYAPLRGLGFETRIYDLTYPMIDLYGNLHFGPKMELFFGQRDITHASRRNTFGLQYQF